MRFFKIIFGLVLVLLLLMSSLCFAFGGKVTYPDGTPAVGAKVTFTDENGNKQAVNCDLNGRFQFNHRPENTAQIQIQAPDGKNYAPAILPAALFDRGETAIVLQPK